MVHSHFRTDPEDASLPEIIDRILDKGIVFDPSIRLGLGITDLCATGNRVVVARERRRKPFIVPKADSSIKQPSKSLRVHIRRGPSSS